jgi:hypothetical protein
MAWNKPARCCSIVRPTPKPPRIAVLGWTEEGFKLQLTGEVGLKFELQRSEDLINWLPLMTHTLINGATEFQDADTKNASHRFYRTRAAP